MDEEPEVIEVDCTGMASIYNAGYAGQIRYKKLGNSIPIYLVTHQNTIDSGWITLSESRGILTKPGKTPQLVALR